MLALVVAAIPRPVAAGEGYSFALSLQRFSQVLRVDDTDVETISERVSIDLWEKTQSNVLLGVALGQSFITQRDYPTASGDDFSGFFGELSMTHPALKAGVIEFAATASYGYHQVASDVSENEIHFHTLATEGSAWLPLTGTLKLVSTISCRVLRGDAVTTQPRNHHNLEESRCNSVALGLELNVDPGGYVMLRAEDGARSGISLSFSRRY